MTISSGKSRASSDSGDVPLEHERRFSLSMKFGYALMGERKPVADYEQGPCLTELVSASLFPA